MDIVALKARIKSNKIPNYMIFTGMEWKVQQIYIEQISKVKKYDVKRIDSITDIYSQLRNKSFLHESALYIVKDDKEILTNETLQTQIDNDLLNDNILIHVLTNVDKRTKFYKKYKDFIIEFNSLENVTLKKYIKKEIPLSDKNCETLISVSENNYGRILLEIDKIKMYASCVAEDKTSIDYDYYFKQLLDNGTIYKSPYDCIFDLINAILDRKNSTFDLLKQCFDNEESTFVILSVLYNSAKAVLQVQSYNGNDLSKATGLNGWQIKNAKAHINKYTDEELIYMLELIQKIEVGIKTGKIDECFAIDYLLVHIL